MKKIKKANMEKLMKVADTMQNETIELKIGDGENEITINVRKSITLDEFYMICGLVAQPPFIVTDDGVTSYVPSAELSNFKVAMVKAFAPEVDLPVNVAEAYMLISRLGLYEKMYSILENTGMFEDLCVIADRFSKYHRLSNTGLSAVENAFKSIDMNTEIAKVMPDVADKLKGMIN